MKSTSDIKKIAKSSLAFFVSSTVVSVLAYGFHLFAARFLDVADYGSLQTLISLQNIGLIPVIILTTLFTRIMAEYKQGNLLEKSILLRNGLKQWIIFPGILFLPLLFIATPFLKSFFNIDSNLLFIFLWLSLYLAILQGIDGGLLNGWHKFLQSNLGTLSNGISKFILGLFFMAIGWGVEGGILGIALGFLIHALINNYFVNSQFALKKELKIHLENKFVFNINKIKKVSKFSYPVIMGIIAVTIFSNVDILIAKHHFEAFDAGRYGALFVLSKIIFFAVSSLSSVVIPLITAEKKYQKKIQYFYLIMSANFAITGIGVALFYLFPEIIIQLLFGQKYLDIAPYLAKFGLLALALSILNIFIQYFISLKYADILVMITIISGMEIIALWFFGESFNQFFDIILISLLAANGISWGYFWIKNGIRR